jgi:hypothetical protein
MRPREIQLPAELDERLKEWARHFRDRRRLERCKSIEGRFNPHAPGSWDSGWGDPEAVPSYLPPIVLPRVLRTHACVSSLAKPGKWAITLGYCYPGLQRYQVLKILRKYCRKRFTWNAYLDELDMARLRIWACLDSQYVQISSTTP